MSIQIRQDNFYMFYWHYSWYWLYIRMCLDLMHNYQSISSISSLSLHRIQNILFNIVWNIYYHVKHNFQHILCIKYQKYNINSLMSKEDMQYHSNSSHLHNNLNINKLQVNCIFYNYLHIVHKSYQKVKYNLLYKLSIQRFRYKLDNFMNISNILFLLDNNHLYIEYILQKMLDNLNKMNLHTFYMIRLLKWILFYMRGIYLVHLNSKFHSH